MDLSNEHNFRKFFNDINDFLFVLDLHGNIIETNDAVVSILGYARDELLGKSVLNIHPAEFREKAGGIVAQMLAGEAVSCPLPLLSKSGQYFPVETRVYHGTWNNENVLIGVSRNLSELALSETKFFEVFNNSQAIMAISEFETGVFTDVNKQFLRVLGYAKEEVIGHSSKEMNLFQDYNQRIEIAAKVSSGEKLESESVTARTKAGGLLYCLLSAAKIQIETHNYLFTAATDITRQRLAENKLKHNLRQQTLLSDISQSLNSIHDIGKKLDETVWLLGEHTNVSRVYIFEDDPSGAATSNTYEWCNTGILPQKEQLQGLRYSSIPSWKKILNEHGKVFSTNITELPADLVEILAPQAIKSLLVLPLAVQDKFFGFIGFDECAANRVWEQGEIDLLTTVANIISVTFERMEFQRLLAESEARLKMAIENTEAGLWDWNITTGAVYFNDSWYRMLGYDREDVEPSVKAWEKLVHPEDMPGVEKALADHLEGRTDIFHTMHRLRTKGGAWKWVLDKGRIIARDQEGKPRRAIGTHIDIDNQKKTEDALRVANATKDKFFSIIAHDLRGPIGTMMQVSELLSEKSLVDEKTWDSFLESQKIMSKNAYRLLENLLNWATYNSNQITPEPKQLDLYGIINDSMADSRPAAVKKSIQLVANLAQCTAFADEEMIKLVVRNLLSNALKFTPQGGRISIGLSSAADRVHVKVSNTGSGITRENIAKILSEDKFYTTYGTEREKGTGLGLKLCKNFIVANNGVLRIESEADRETSFSFSLPALKQ